MELCEGNSAKGTLRKPGNQEEERRHRRVGLPAESSQRHFRIPIRCICARPFKRFDRRGLLQTASVLRRRRDSPRRTQRRRCPHHKFIRWVVERRRSSPGASTGVVSCGRPVSFVAGEIHHGGHRGHRGDGVPITSSYAGSSSGSSTGVVSCGRPPRPFGESLATIRTATPSRREDGPCALLLCVPLCPLW